MLPLELGALRQAVTSGRTFEYRFFWGHTPRPDGKLSNACLSQWWPCSFTIDGTRYTTAEQWMMASKARLFGDREALIAILAATQPKECKALGRAVRDFDEATWRQHRFDIVTAGNVAKFGQDSTLRAYLLATGEEILVEASPTDCVWGIRQHRQHPDAQDPLRWRGQNLLGFALMRARSILRGELVPPSLPARLTASMAE